MHAVSFVSSTPVDPSSNHYILDGETGDGSSWDNALDSLPATLVRGDTYYIGDGTYGAYRYDDSESSGAYIYIKKATASDHGTDVGWSSNYGDGQATFTGTQTFTKGYYEINGNNVPSQGLATKWGFKITGTPGLSRGIYINGNNDLSHIKISNLHIDMSGDTTGENKCIKGTFGDTDNTYITVNYCKLENFGDAISIDSDDGNIIYEYNYFHRTADDGTGDHGDAIVLAPGDSKQTTDYIIRYNIFNWNGQNIYFSGYSYWAFNNFQIYGNLHYCDETPYASCAGIHQNSDGPSITNLAIFNNTFYNVYYAVHARVDSTMSGYFKNNIMYDCNTIDLRNLITHDYNYYETGTSISEDNIQFGGNPFVNSAIYNLQLSGATNSGDSSVGVDQYTSKDLLGNTRGTGTWDRGAYEFID
jgi:hypothetical protein